MPELSTLPGVNRLRAANKAAVAEFFDVSLPAIDGWVRRGCPVLQRGSKTIPWIFDLLQVAEWRINGQRGDPDVDPDSLPPAERKAWYEGESKKRDLQIKDRELIPAPDVEQAVATAFAAIAQDLRAIPDNLERRHGMDGATAQRVEEAIFEAMESLAERLGALAPIEAEASE